MRKTRKAAAVLTAVAMAAVSAVPAMADEIKAVSYTHLDVYKRQRSRICMIMSFRQEKLRLGTFYSLS